MLCLLSTLALAAGFVSFAEPVMSTELRVTLPASARAEAEAG